MDRETRQQSVLDPETQARWDAWLDARVTAMLKEFRDEVVFGLLLDIVGEELGKMLKQRDNEARSIRDEIAGLRTDVEIITKIQRGEIARLKTDVKHAASR